MARNGSKRWKGCQLCSPHKHAGHGDAERMPWRYRRQLGKKRRVSRHDVD